MMKAGWREEVARSAVSPVVLSCYILALDLPTNRTNWLKLFCVLPQRQCRDLIDTRKRKVFDAEEASERRGCSGPRLPRARVSPVRIEHSPRFFHKWQKAAANVHAVSRTDCWFGCHALLVAKAARRRRAIWRACARALTRPHRGRSYNESRDAITPRI